jgi:hypothetical protein
MKANRKEYLRNWYQANKARQLELGRTWRKNNADKRRITEKRSRRKNMTKFRAYQREYKKKKRLNNPSYIMEYRLRRRVNKVIARAGATKSASTFDLVGCSPSDLMTHLEATFTKGMSWDRRDELHIDHIVPCCAFDLTSPEEQKKCFHYTNLRMLWAKDNLQKGSRHGV